jgi:hypothetical protein
MIVPNAVTSRRLTRAALEQVAHDVRDMCYKYHTRKKGELPTDRLFFGYLAGMFRQSNQRNTPVVRQAPGHGLGKSQRIDFVLRPVTNGTYIELVVRAKGAEWYRSQNQSEINKLCRVQGVSQRAIVIVDLSTNPALIPEDIAEDYDGWKTTAGRFGRRDFIVTYAGPDGAFTVRPRRG